MRVLKSFQRERVSDPVRSKYAMIAPVFEATLFSLKVSRVNRLGGYDKITVEDLAREFRRGDGDIGICFEYAVHDAIARRDKTIHPLASEVLEDFCKLKQGADSILFGPEKDGRIPILESVQDALTEDSVLYVGNRGRPPQLRKYIPQIIKAFHRNEERNSLPRSIRGIWKADLFLGSRSDDGWVGTTVKINPDHLRGARGLRVGIYPRVNNHDSPRLDTRLNLIRLPLPYDRAFMELFYKSFDLVSAFLKNDAKVPKPVRLPDSEDRFIATELEKRRSFPLLDVLEAIREMSQRHLLKTKKVEEVKATATLSEEKGLELKTPKTEDQLVSLAPGPEPSDD